MMRAQWKPLLLSILLQLISISAAQEQVADLTAADEGEFESSGESFEGSGESAESGLEPDSSEETKYPDCPPKLDVVFLLDTSGSIKQIFQEHVRWTVTLVDTLPVDRDAVRVAAVQFAGFPLTEFALGTYPAARDIREHLQQMQFRSGVTRTGDALRRAELELFRDDRGGRHDAAKVIVLFTDGLSIDDPLKPANQLRSIKHVKIYVVGLSEDGFLPEMDGIAGERDRVFGPDDLPRLRTSLLRDVEEARRCSRIGNIRTVPDRKKTGERPNGNNGERLPVLQPINEETLHTVKKLENGASVRSGLPVAIEDDKQEEDDEDEEDEIDEKSVEDQEKSESESKLEKLNQEETEKSELDKLNQEETEKSELDKSNQEDIEKLDLEKSNQEEIEPAFSRDQTEQQKFADVSIKDLRQANGKSLVQTGEKPELAKEKPKSAHTVVSTERPRTPAGKVFPRFFSTRRPFAQRRARTSRRTTTKPRRRTQTTEPRRSSRTTQRPWTPTGVSRRMATFSRRSPNNNNNNRQRLDRNRQPSAGLSRWIPNYHRNSGSSNKKSNNNNNNNNNNRFQQTSRQQSSHQQSSRQQSSRQQLSHQRSSFGARRRHQQQQLSARARSSSARRLPANNGRRIQLATTSSRPRTTESPELRARLEQRGRNARPGECPLDILLILDSSGSVQHAYADQKQFIDDLLEDINVSERDHRIALVQFAGDQLQKTEWHFDTFDNKQSIRSAFGRVRHFTGTTYIGAALERANTILNSRRRGVASLILLVSDGYSQDDAFRAAERLRRQPRSKFYAVSMAKLNNVEYLSELTASRENVFVGDHEINQLKRILKSEMTCRPRS